MKQYYKTKLCPFYEKGSCKFGPNCQFAHSINELREKENLSKTKICPKLKTTFCDNPNCKYAHSKQELKCTDDYYKTRLCTYWQKGKCNDKSNCRHAHGIEELRLLPSNHLSNILNQVPSSSNQLAPTYNLNEYIKERKNNLPLNDNNINFEHNDSSISPTPITSTPPKTSENILNLKSPLSFASTDTDLKFDPLHELYTPYLLPNYNPKVSNPTPQADHINLSYLYLLKDTNYNNFVNTNTNLNSNYTFNNNSSLLDKVRIFPN